MKEESYIFKSILMGAPHVEVAFLLRTQFTTLPLVPSLAGMQPPRIYI